MRVAEGAASFQQLKALASQLDLIQALVKVNRRSPMRMLRFERST
jgi:hypothetical protein